MEDRKTSNFKDFCQQFEAAQMVKYDWKPAEQAIADGKRYLVFEFSLLDLAEFNDTSGYTGSQHELKPTTVRPRDPTIYGAEIEFIACERLDDVERFAELSLGHGQEVQFASVDDDHSRAARPAAPAP